MSDDGNPDGKRFDLQRFTDAQQPVYETALAELRNGDKRSHWMWFIFPQLRELGRSGTARHYGIGGLDEATAYLRHPLLGARLCECTQAVLDVRGGSLDAIFGSPDNLKFVSSMTLFGRVPQAPDLFIRALGRYNGGAEDERTLRLLLS